MAYLDTSAFVKLPLQEREHESLRVALAGWEAFVASALLEVEAVRACAPAGAAYAQAAEQALGAVSLIAIDRDVLRAAARLRPAGLRSLDAIHLATALSLGDDLGVFVCYDQRLCEAARAQGLPVVSPGSSDG